jgi:hypothetical protein
MTTNGRTAMLTLRLAPGDEKRLRDLAHEVAARASLTTETAAAPPERAPGEAVAAALTDRRQHLNDVRADLAVQLARTHAAADEISADILDIDAQLDELEGATVLESMTTEALTEAAADRGLAVIDAEQHRWYQAIATRAGAMDGTRNEARDALWAILRPSAGPLTAATYADVDAVLDYLAGGAA